MRDSGLEEAIQAIGGVGALARGLGISQPSVSNWKRIPPERVLQIEELTGVQRSVLRPDLYPDTDGAMVDEEDAARAAEYSLLASLLLRAPDADFLERLGTLKGDASAMGLAHLALADAARSADAAALQREYFDLFVGLGRGELLPYGSYYLTGFLHERPLARLREDLARIGLARTEGHHEPEDHIGTILEIMGLLAGGEVPADVDEQHRFFDRHLKPWAGRFFADLAVARAAKFYRAVAQCGAALIAIETEAFGLPS